jgi:hypothetical protein
MTSSTPYYRLSHIIVKNMLIQMWSKCEVRGDQGKAESIMSTTESSVVYRWFFHQTPLAISLALLRLTHEDTHNPHCLPPLQENVAFLSHKKSRSSSPMWEVNFVVSSIITMYNMWCLLWRILHEKWQFDNPPPCKKHQDAWSSFCIHFSIERCKEFCHGS